LAVWGCGATSVCCSTCVEQNKRRSYNDANSDAFVAPSNPNQDLPGTYLRY
ncbi:MAG: hypothetical protein BJ554DRAFT_2795, partial [Olpidium bornovanus]